MVLAFELLEIKGSIEINDNEQDKEEKMLKKRRWTVGTIH